ARQANRVSSNAAISGDGRYVSFASAASNLVRHDRNHQPDVFVWDRVTRTTRLVSVSSGGRQQNAAVAAPFTQISSLSADGRYVAFDSDATNLVPGDRNDHTDVFRRDLLRHRTVLVSRSSLGKPGDNDS